MNPNILISDKEESYCALSEGLDYTELMESYISIIYEDIEEILTENTIMKLEEYSYLYEAKNKTRKSSNKITGKEKIDGSGGRLERTFSSIAKFFVKIKNFIKSILVKFKDKVLNLIKSNEKWFNDNLEALNNISTAQLESININIIPYWKVNRLNESITNTVKSTQGNVKALTDEKFHNDNALYQWAAPKLYAIDKEDSVNAAKYYYRGTNDVVKISGGQNVRIALNTMIDYCRNYKKLYDNIDKDGLRLIGVIDSYNNAIKNASGNTNEYNKASREAEKKVEESYDYMLSVLEANENKNEPKNGSVTTSNNETNPASSPKQVDNIKQENAFQATIKLMNLAYRVYAAKLTIAEEIYYKYINILKSVLANAKSDNIKNTGDSKGNKNSVDTNTKFKSNNVSEKDKEKSRNIFGRFMDWATK